MTEKNNLIGRLGTSGLLTISSLAGCSLPTGFNLGETKHKDLSKSHYALEIANVADSLVNNGRTQDFLAAAELYGSVGKVEEMDKAFKQYLQKEPRSALIYAPYFDGVHETYASREKKQGAEKIEVAEKEK